MQTTVVVLAGFLIEVEPDRRVAPARAALFVLGPVAAAFTHLLLSPGREFAADRAAARICESPHGLADGLLRLEAAGSFVEFRASPATEPLYTVNPFAEQGLAAMFVTHPPLGERVRRLRELDPEWRDRLRAASSSSPGRSENITPSRLGPSRVGSIERRTRFPPEAAPSRPRAATRGCPDPWRARCGRGRAPPIAHLLSVRSAAVASPRPRAFAASQ